MSDDQNNSISDKKLKRLANKMQKNKAYLDLLKNKKEEAEVLKRQAEDSENDDDNTKRLKTENENDKLSEKEEGEISDDESSTPHSSPSKDDPQQLVALSTKVRQEIRQLKAQIDDNGDAPNLSLTEAGSEAKFEFLYSGDDEPTKPLFIRDIQDLILFAALGGISPAKPRWCTILRLFNVSSIVVIVAEGVSVDHVKRFPESFSNCRKLLSRWVEVFAAASYNSNIMRDLILLQQAEVTSASNKSKYRYRSIVGCSPSNIPLDKLFPIKSEEESGLIPEVADTTDEVFPRTQLILDLFQLVDNNFPLPSAPGVSDCSSRLSKECYLPVSEKSPMFSIDCEMVFCEGHIQELARISVVNEKLECIYDVFVKPKNRIVDYCTQFSGITPEIMEGKTSSLEEVKAELRRLLPPNAILVGHSLDCDLKVIQIAHPYCIDTTTIFNLYGYSFRKNKLRVLTKELLGKDIQNGSTGHDSTEDATATMQLVQLKLRKGIAFGNTTLGWSILSHTQNDPGSTPTTPVSSPIVDIAANRQTPIPYYDGRHGAFSTIFHHTTLWKKNVSVVGLDSSIAHCKTLAPSILDMEEVSVVTAKSNGEMFKIVNGILHLNKTRMVLQLVDMTHDLEGDRDDRAIRKSLQKLDSRIAKVHEAQSTDSLLMVLFGGSSRPLERNALHSGLCMIQIKE